MYRVNMYVKYVSVEYAHFVHRANFTPVTGNSFFLSVVDEPPLKTEKISLFFEKVFVFLRFIPEKSDIF